MRLLKRSQALLAPDAISTLNAFLQAQSIESEEMSSSDLMVLVTHDASPPGLGKGFVFETANHRSARQWMHEVMTDHELRKFP